MEAYDVTCSTVRITRRSRNSRKVEDRWGCTVRGTLRDFGYVSSCMRYVQSLERERAIGYLP